MAASLFIVYNSGMIDKSDYSFLVDPPTTTNKRAFYKISLDYHHVSPINIQGYRNVKGLQRNVLKVLGKPVDEVTNEEIAKLIVSNFQAKMKAIEDTRALKAKERTRLTSNQRMIVNQTARTREDKVELRMADYLAFYEAKTANDQHSLRQLCSLEVAIDDLETIENTMLKSLQNPAKAAEISDSYINSISNTRIKYLTEYRQLQVLLGIDRLTRDKRESEQGGTDYMRQLMLSAKDLLEKKAVKIQCKTCMTENSTILAQGFVLAHFPKWRFESECPLCHGKIELSG